MTAMQQELDNLDQQIADASQYVQRSDAPSHFKSLTAFRRESQIVQASIIRQEHSIAQQLQQLCQS